ncbi:MAG TPA: alpha/beta hydrolase [Myxococcales bacterium]|jgi:pimeloyl-ACP methyl ester carboxylesterase|nr:alpha/beta hydrolase [Myxococcales bacterium]
MRFVNAGVLKIAYEEYGAGQPVVLLHGFPYDAHAFDEVAPLLTGARVIVPYLRGYGPTRYLRAETLRSGQQAALGADLLALLDALKIPKAVLGGYDWGGRAACIVAALKPERVSGLVTVNGYNIHDVPHALEPSLPENEYRYWYQWYFQVERGRAGLAKHRASLCKLLWQLWSPKWKFSDETYARTAASFDNPDFVDTVIQSYRARYGLTANDPAYEEWEQLLTKKPPITVPTIHLDGTADGVLFLGGTSGHRPLFTGRYEYRTIEDAGHNIPQEKPQAFADAVKALL